VLRTVEGDEIYVVPLFISEGYFTEQVIPRELRLDGWDVSEWNSDGLSADQATLIAEDIDREVHYCGPVGTHRAMTDVIVRRAESVTGNSDVGEGSGSPSSATVPSATRTRRKRSSTTPTGSPSATASTR